MLPTSRYLPSPGLVFWSDYCGHTFATSRETFDALDRSFLLSAHVRALHGFAEGDLGAEMALVAVDVLVDHAVGLADGAGVYADTDPGRVGLVQRPMPAVLRQRLAGLSGGLVEPAVSLDALDRDYVETGVSFSDPHWS